VPGPFVSLGFIARSGAERRQALMRAGATGFPVVLFEAPTRLAETLAELAGMLGHRPAVVAREMTKLFEEFRHGPLAELAGHYAAEPPRGEIVIVIGAADDTPDQLDDPDAIVRSLLAAGLKPSAAAREAAALTGRQRGELYAIALEIGKEGKTPLP